MELRPLSHTPDSALAGSDRDVRGWDVRTDVDDEKVGSVDDMLLDDTGRLRYLDVDLGLLRKHVLVPIGQARTDARRDVVWVPGMTRDRFEDIPEWNQDVRSLDRTYEDRLAAAYLGDSARDDADSREAAGRTGELRELDDLDGYHIPKESPNPKGWTVVTADGREVGEVDELIVDTSAMAVRYLDCDLDQGELGFDKDRERHVLIPLQRVRLDREDKQVFVDGLTSDRLRDLPVYGGLPVASDFESRLQQAFGGETPSGTTGEAGRSDDARFDDRRFYGERLRGRSGSSPEEAPSLRDREPLADDERMERLEERGPRADAPARDDQDRQMQAEAEERRVAEDAQRAAERQMQADTQAQRMGEDMERAAGEGTRLRPDEEVRIRVRGDEIIIEKRPKE